MGGNKIAKRGMPGTPEAGDLGVAQPGYSISDDPNGDFLIRTSDGHLIRLPGTAQPGASYEVERLS